MDHDLSRLRLAVPAKFSGDGKVAASEWLMEVCRWLRLNNVSEDRWGAVMMSQLSGAAQSWLNHLELQVVQGVRALPVRWEDFARELRAIFEPVTSVEAARRDLRRLKQTTTVGAYVHEFHRLVFKIPDLSREEQHSIFVEGLQDPHKGTVIALSAGNIDEAIRMAERLAATTGNRYSQIRPQNRFRRGGWRPRQPQRYPAATGERKDSVAVIENKKKQKGPSRPPMRQVKCYLCDGNHVVRDCPQLADARKRLN